MPGLLRASHAEGADIVALKVLASGLAVDRPLAALLAEAAQHVAAAAAPTWRAAAAAAADGEAPATVLARAVPPAFTDAIAACEPRALPAALDAVAGACARRHAAVSAVRQAAGYPALVAGAALATVFVWLATSRAQASALALDVLGEPARHAFPGHIVVYAFVVIPLFAFAVVPLVRGTLPGWLRLVQGGGCIDSMAELAWLEGIRVFAAADVADRRDALVRACDFVPDGPMRRRFARRMAGPPGRWPVSLAARSLALAWIDGVDVDASVGWRVARNQLMVTSRLEILSMMLRVAFLVSAAAAVLGSMALVVPGSVLGTANPSAWSATTAWYSHVFFVTLFAWIRFGREGAPDRLERIQQGVALLAAADIEPRRAMAYIRSSLDGARRGANPIITRAIDRLDAGESAVGGRRATSMDRELAEHLDAVYRSADPGDRRAMAMRGREHGPAFRPQYGSVVAGFALLSTLVMWVPSESARMFREYALAGTDPILELSMPGLVLAVIAILVSLTPIRRAIHERLARARVADALADGLAHGREPLASRLDAAAWGAGGRRMRVRLQRAAAAVRDGARVTGALHDAGLAELAVAFASPSDATTRLRRCAELLRAEALHRDRVIRAAAGGLALTLAAIAVALLTGDLFGALTGITVYAMDHVMFWMW